MPDIYYDVDVALAAVPINKLPIVDVDGVTVDTGMVFNEAGLSLEWNFVTSAGAYTHDAVTPTDTAGAYDFVNQGEGMYTIEIPASGGGTINNDTEGYGWFTGNCTANLPWSSPIFGFRAVGLNDALCDGGDVLDTNVTQWLGTAAATPTVAGVPEVDTTHISGTPQTANDVGGDVNTILLDTQELQTDWVNGGRLDLILDIIAADTTTDIPALIAAHEAKTDIIDANVDLILEDTGTTLDAALAVVDANVDLVLEDTGTTLPGTLTTIETKIDTIDANVDTAVAGIITFAVTATGPNTITSCTTNLSIFSVDQMIGRLLTFTSGVCAGEQTDILDFAVTNGVLTYTALTLAPGSGDTGKIT